MNSKIIVLFWTIVVASSQLQCETPFAKHGITYISSNPLSPLVYDLGTSSSSATDCKQKCQDINYLCDAENKLTDERIHGQGTDFFTTNSNQCKLTVTDSNGYNGVGSWLWLTPDIAASEYIVELNFRIASGNGEAGIVFAASPLTNVYVVVNPSSDLIVIGNIADGGWSEWDSVNFVTMHNVDYTMKVHKQADGHWQFYIDDVLRWSSSSSAHIITDGQFPNHYAGVYSWKATIQANWLKVSFPSSAEETVCSAYTYDTTNNECFGYYGTDYAAIYNSLSENTQFDSGIISPTCWPTASPTLSPTVDTQSPTKQAPAQSDAQSTVLGSISFTLIMINIVLPVCGAVACCFGCGALIFWLCYKRRRELVPDKPPVTENPPDSQLSGKNITNTQPYRPYAWPWKSQQSKSHKKMDTEKEIELQPEGVGIRFSVQSECLSEGQPKQAIYRKDNLSEGQAIYDSKESSSSDSSVGFHQDHHAVNKVTNFYGVDDDHINEILQYDRNGQQIVDAILTATKQTKD